jgi:methyltransferase family protein
MKKIAIFILVSFFILQCLHGREGVEELKREVCTILPSIHGWCSKEKAVNFMDLVLEVEPEVCVEIGVFGGSSLFPVASALKFLNKGIIIGIDPWDKKECVKYFDPVVDRAHIDWWNKVDLNQIYAAYLNMLSKYKLTNHSITMKATSEKAALAIGDIDILYLDGNHGEFAALTDVQLYLPKVRYGGYIWLNDCLWLETQNALDLLFESCEMVRSVDDGNCILFRKREP